MKYFSYKTLNPLNPLNPIPPKKHSLPAVEPYWKFDPILCDTYAMSHTFSLMSHALSLMSHTFSRMRLSGLVT